MLKHRLLCFRAHKSGDTQHVGGIQEIAPREEVASCGKSSTRCLVHPLGGHTRGDFVSNIWRERHATYTDSCWFGGVVGCCHSRTRPGSAAPNRQGLLLK